MAAVNFYEDIRQHPGKFRQLSCKNLLFAHYKCPQLEKKGEYYSPCNFIAYTFTGRKRVHKSGHHWDMEIDVALFGRKGAYIFERMDLEEHCVMMFFIPDSYLQDISREYRAQLPLRAGQNKLSDPVIQLELTATTKAFFHSMIAYFTEPPPENLLELKFKELLLNLITNPRNKSLLAIVNSLQVNQRPPLQEVMEENFLFNLSMEDFAKISLRSLPTFKREFKTLFGTTPAKWLLEKKLETAHVLLHSTSKRVNEIAFECGFENNTHFSRVFKARYGKSPAFFRKDEVVSHP